MLIVLCYRFCNPCNCSISAQNGELFYYFFLAFTPKCFILTVAAISAELRAILYCWTKFAKFYNFCAAHGGQLCAKFCARTIAEFWRNMPAASGLYSKLRCILLVQPILRPKRRKYYFHKTTYLWNERSFCYRKWKLLENDKNHTPHIIVTLRLTSGHWASFSNIASFSVSVRK